MQHVLGPYGLGYIPERVHGRSPDRFFVRFQHLQQLEANTHPLAGSHELRAPIGDAADQVDACAIEGETRRRRECESLCKKDGLGEKGSKGKNHSVSAINPQIFGVVSDRFEVSNTLLRTVLLHLLVAILQDGRQARQ